MTNKCRLLLHLRNPYINCTVLRGIALPNMAVPFKVQAAFYVQDTPS